MAQVSTHAQPKSRPEIPMAPVGSPIHRGFARPIDEPTASMLLQLMGVLIAAAGVGGWVAVIAGGVLDLAAHPLLLIAVSAIAVILGPMVTPQLASGPATCTAGCHRSSPFFSWRPRSW
jgi:hypothetical protein